MRLIPSRCASKIQYPGRKAAAQVASRVKNRTGEDIKGYHCPEGGHWHIGHPIGSRRPNQGRGA